jgi:hypothetical protein
MRRAVILAVLALGACSTPRDPVEAAYDHCVAQITAKAWSANEKAVPPEQQAQFKDGFRKMAAASCNVIRDTCAKDRDGAVCKGLLGKYGG